MPLETRETPRSGQYEGDFALVRRLVWTVERGGASISMRPVYVPPQRRTLRRISIGDSSLRGEHTMFSQFRKPGW